MERLELIANTSNFAIAFLPELLTLWSKANLLSNLTPRNFSQKMTLREKCPYTPYLSVFSPNARKYRPEKLHIRTLFTQCVFNDWIPNLDLIWILCAYHQTEAICFIFHLIILKPFKWLFGWKSFGNNINVVTYIIKGIVISITSKVNIIQNKKNKRNWERKRTDHWEICWTK